MTTPQLSVCIPAYNQPELLAEALHSLCDQGLDRDAFTVIVSDDASPRSLEDVVGNFRDRLHVVHHRSPSNIGHLANFARAAELATTPFIAFLAHDDVIAPGQLGRALRVFEADPATVLVAALTLCQRYPGAVDTQLHGMFLKGDGRARYDAAYRWDATEWLALSLITTPLSITGSVFRRDAFARCRRWLGFPLWHDRLMLAEMGLHGTVASLPWIGGHYRINRSQLSQQLWEQHTDEFRAVTATVLEMAATANAPVIDFWADLLCEVPHFERGIYLRQLNTALPGDRFTQLRTTCERRLGHRLPLTRLERLRIPRVLADLVRDLDRRLAGRTS